MLIGADRAYLSGHNSLFFGSRRK